jgi:hypothetical protein
LGRVVGRGTKLAVEPVQVSCDSRPWPRLPGWLAELEVCQRRIQRGHAGLRLAGHRVRGGRWERLLGQLRGCHAQRRSDRLKEGAAVNGAFTAFNPGQVALGDPSQLRDSSLSHPAPDTDLADPTTDERIDGGGGHRASPLHHHRNEERCATRA